MEQLLLIGIAICTGVYIVYKTIKNAAAKSCGNCVDCSSCQYNKAKKTSDKEKD